MEIKISTIKAVEIKKLIDEIPEFEPTSIEKIEERILGKDVFLFASHYNSEITGFIIAYKITNDTFYNWLTGVLPEFRSKKIATKLFNSFENYAIDNNCKFCRVKSMNKFRTMLNTLKTRNYHIADYESDKIIFEKIF